MNPSNPPQAAEYGGGTYLLRDATELPPPLGEIALSQHGVQSMNLQYALIVIQY